MNDSHADTAPVSDCATTTEPEPKRDVQVPQPAPSWRSRTVTDERREHWIDAHMPFLRGGRD
jgi:hypothetical protein